SSSSCSAPRANLTAASGRPRLLRVLDIAEHALVATPSAVGQRVPEADGVRLVTLDERRYPTNALRAQDALGRPNDLPPESGPPGFGRDRQAIDVAAPAVPSADDAADDGALLDRDEEMIGVIAHEPRDLLERVGRARNRARAHP